MFNLGECQQKRVAKPPTHVDEEPKKSTNENEDDSLWWYSPDVQEVSSQDIEEQIFAESLINSKIQFWSELSKKEKDHYKAEMLIKSPKVILGDYNNACKWLLKAKGIINPSFRDTFSAGGQETIFGVKVPKIIANIYKWKSDIIEVLNNSDSPNDSFELWKEHISKMTKFSSNEKKVLLRIVTEIGKEVH
ncbi:hypothetical protein [Fibrobacter sp. UWH5]|uniref:hypothetical protein n=1 Tax=Fibrobacter sp. UWH5 TaxID=1896211 RepID=UPI00093486A1|nr:hypothetical protein [Fibrobacter sp. UWH5]